MGWGSLVAVGAVLALDSDTAWSGLVEAGRVGGFLVDVLLSVLVSGMVLWLFGLAPVLAAAPRPRRNPGPARHSPLCRGPPPGSAIGRGPRPQSMRRADSRWAGAGAGTTWRRGPTSGPRWSGRCR